MIIVLLYADINDKIISAHQVIINTTPLGTFPDVEGYPPIPYAAISEGTLFI